MRPEPLDPIAAFEAIQRLLEGHDSIAFSAHARQRMRDRQFTVDDVRRVLMYGTVSAKPEWNATFQNWRYEVRGRDYDNIPLVLVIALEPALARITIITGKDD